MRNNLYNFRNTIRHFINIDNIEMYKSVEEIELKDLSWTFPLIFRVKKKDNKYRMLKIPNILNFLCSHNRFKDVDNFKTPNKIDERKRLSPNLTTGDFNTGVFDVQLERDLLDLCIYDNLLKLDIKAYYERIYTHDIEFYQQGDENFLANLNAGNTNGLIMGNYISLFFAEKHLKKISDGILNALKDEKIDCKFSYFSDDFYFFCNERDNQKVIDIFDNSLERFNLERKDGEIEVWDYISYNDYNLIEKYWKKIITECEIRFDDAKDNNILYFTNQLIYRMTKLVDEKSKKTFINTFFKSTYFYELNLNKFKMEEYNFHQLCYIYKFCPESLIYSIDKFKEFEYFRGEDFKKFLRVRYIEALSKSFNEEQLYYFYAIKILNYLDILKETKEKVVNSNNQTLISHYLKDSIFGSEEIDYLKNLKNEEYWFQNYHLILFSDLLENLDNSINEYLLPEYATKPRQKDNYREFYKINLNKKNVFINDSNVITEKVKIYLGLKLKEKTEVFLND